MDRVDLGWLPDAHRALSLPLLNSSPSAGAALCKSQNKYKPGWEDTWLAKVELKSHKPLFRSHRVKAPALGRVKGMVLS